MVSSTIVAVAGVAAIVFLIVPMLYLTVIGVQDDHRAPTEPSGGEED